MKYKENNSLIPDSLELQQVACFHKHSECRRSRGQKVIVLTFTHILIEQNFLNTCKLKEWNASWSPKKEDAAYSGNLLDINIWRATFISPLSRKSLKLSGAQFLVYSIHHASDGIRIFPKTVPHWVSHQFNQLSIRCLSSNVSQFSPSQPAAN